MLAYTFPDFIPGFAESGINTLPFVELVNRPTENARQEGKLLFRDDFLLTSSQIAKVEGDIFELLEAAVHWNAAARWNGFMAGDEWPSSPRYPRQTAARALNRQIAVLSLPRRYDWVRLLDPAGRDQISEVRAELSSKELSLPTSTPDILVVALPREYQTDKRFRMELDTLNFDSQRRLSTLYRA